ncbi:MAG: tyrosine recombinase [Oscillospiraceae bacterium]
MDKLEKYYTFLKYEKKVSKNTFDSYRRDIAKFADYLSANDNMDLNEVTQDNIKDFLDFLKNKGAAPSSLTRNLAAVRSLYRFLISENLANFNPTADVRLPKFENPLPTILTPQEVGILIDVPHNNTLKGIRDIAIMELLYATGMHVSEVIDISLKDVNIRVGYVRCRGRERDRIIPIYSKCQAALKMYVDYVRPVFYYERVPYKDDSDVLFLNQKGSSLSRQGVWKMIKHYAAKTEIPKEITPNILRHSFAVHLLENGADFRSLQEMLGYTEASAINRYVKIAENRIAEVYKRTHPRASNDL